MRRASAGPHLRHVGVLLGHHEARGVERPADLVGQEAFDRGDGVIEPPQVPHLHQPVLARRQQQVPGRDESRVSQLVSFILSKPFRKLSGG